MPRAVHSIGRIPLAAALLAGLSVAGSAQAPSSPGSASGTSKYADMKVSVDVESGRLVEVIPKLLKSVGAEFVIEPDVKNALVTGHIRGIKLSTALEVLLRTSSMPVQAVFDKGVYRFSKRVDPPPAQAAPRPPDEPLLPPPPTTQTDDVDIHNVQTYDLLRVLNGLFGVPVSIDPSAGPPESGRASTGSFAARGQASGSAGGSPGHGGAWSFSIGGHPINLGRPGR